jgi:hypothetical protein
MRWFKPNLRSSIHAIFSSSYPPEPGEQLATMGIDDIRAAMLAAMPSTGAEKFPHVTRRIRYAGDVQGLWFLRGDLMAVLSSHFGEAVAFEKLETISAMFKDLLPQGLRSRPSPLSPHR